MVAFSCVPQSSLRWNTGFAFLLLFLLGGDHAVAGLVKILLPNGLPAAGAEAAPLPTNGILRVSEMQTNSPKEAPSVILPEDGVLEITGENAGRWIILHESGWADTKLQSDSGELILQPWNTLKGTVSVETRNPNHHVEFFRQPELDQQEENGGELFWRAQAEIEPDGTFTFEHLPSGAGWMVLISQKVDNQRVFRWMDYPSKVQLPENAFLEISPRGALLKGRVASMDASEPSVVTIHCLESRLHYSAIAEKDGSFAIPGLLPGEYELVARANRGLSEEHPVVRGFSVGMDEQELDLGEITKDDFPFVFSADRRLELARFLLPKVLDAARLHSSDPIERIWLGELYHPFGPMGARVTFAPATDAEDPTSATRKLLTGKLPGKWGRAYYPEVGFESFSFRPSEDPFFDERLMEIPVRRFPLQNQTVFLSLDESIEYEEVLKLLLAIESGGILQAPPPERKASSPWSGSGGSFSAGGFPTAEILPTIVSIERKTNPDRIEVKTLTSSKSGVDYFFQKSEDGFRFQGGGPWRS